MCVLRWLLGALPPNPWHLPLSTNGMVRTALVWNILSGEISLLVFLPCYWPKAQNAGVRGGAPVAGPGCRSSRAVGRIILATVWRRGGTGCRGGGSRWSCTGLRSGRGADLECIGSEFLDLAFVDDCLAQRVAHAQKWPGLVFIQVSFLSPTYYTRYLPTSGWHSFPGAGQDRAAAF